MKFTAFTLVSAIIGAVSAQSVTWVSPAPGAAIKAGVAFDAVVQFQDTTSSVEVVAVSFGLRASNDPETTDLGESILGHVFEPTFTTGENGAFVTSLQLTVPTNIPVNQTYQLSLAEFFLLGAENTASVFTDDIQVFIH